MDAGSGAGAGAAAGGATRITWDEAVIAEHDKDRGTRQRIEHRDSVPCCSESDRRGEPADAGADDNDLLAHGATSRFDRSA
jgi:hypothetical protein